MAHQEYSSPDGILTLVVSDEDGNSAIGFKGFRWHTHGDVLAATYPVVDGTRLMPQRASQRLVEDIVGNRAVIAILRSGGEIRDVWITDDATRELRYKQPDESIEFRYWDGTKASASVRESG